MKRPKTFPYVPSDDDVERLVKGCQDTPRDRRTKALALLLADSGLRITEALRLHIEDVDLGLRSCTIREGKGQKPRVTFFGATTARILRDHLTKREGAYREDFLFAADDGVPWTRFQAAWFLESLSCRVGLKRCVSPHMLRHFFATAFLRAGETWRACGNCWGTRRWR